MSLQNAQCCLSSESLEYQLVRIRDAISLKETEDSWDTIAQGIQTLNVLVKREAHVIPQDTLQALRSLAHSINSAVLSERSRLSAMAIELLSTAVVELGSSFESLLSVFLPTLFTLCTRTNKVFIGRARACIFTIIESTQSPIILSHLCRYAKDKSTALRLTVAECAFACLNSFNPPDLQREAKSREVELLIKCAVTDANGDIRRYGRKMYDAYRILLPDRVESFTAPLTPTVRKYLNISIVPKQTAACVSSSSLNNGVTSTQSSRSLSKQQPRSDPDMPPLNFAPSRSQRDPPPQTAAAPQRPISTMETTSTNDFPLQRQKVGPLRPTRFQTVSRPPSVVAESSAEAIKRPGGARRVPLPEHPPAKDKLQDDRRTAKGPSRPPSSCDLSDSSTQQSDSSHARHRSAKIVEGKAGGRTKPPSTVLPSRTVSLQLDVTGQVSKDVPTTRHGVRPTSRLNQPARSQLTKADPEKQRGKLRTRPTAKRTNIQRQASSKVQESATIHATRRIEGKRQRQATSNNKITPHAEVVPPALVPLPPSPIGDCTPGDTGVADVAAVPIDNAQERPYEDAASSLPTSPTFAIDAVTPKASSSSIPVISVAQTPISALVESIRRGFVLNPQSLDCTFEEEEEDDEEGERTFIAKCPPTLPLSWGQVLSKSHSTNDEDIHYS